jgi:hypothetical protein
MNWGRLVKGSSFLDYSVLPEGVSLLAQLNQAALQACDATYDSVGCRPYLLFPPLTDARDLVDTLLHCSPRGRYGFHVIWAEAFFAKRHDGARAHASLPASVNVEPSKYGVFSRTSGSVFFTYTYK